MAEHRDGYGVTLRRWRPRDAELYGVAVDGSVGLWRPHNRSGRRIRRVRCRFARPRKLRSDPSAAADESEQRSHAAAELLLGHRKQPPPCRTARDRSRECARPRLHHRAAHCRAEQQRGCRDSLRREATARARSGSSLCCRRAPNPRMTKLPMQNASLHPVPPALQSARSACGGWTSHDCFRHPAVLRPWYRIGD